VKKIKFIQINKENEKQLQQLLSMWIPYYKEIGSAESESAITKYARQRVNIQGKREDMHFELCFDDSILIGFCYYAVDLGGIRGVLPPSLGYIMEFYINPSYRRNGLGTHLYNFIKQKFISCEAKDIWLTAAKVNGEPFWFSLGFADTGEIENELKILKIAI